MTNRRAKQRYSFCLQNFLYDEATHRNVPGGSFTHKPTLIFKVKVTYTLSHTTNAHRGSISTVSLTWVQEGDGWSIPRLGRFTPSTEARYPFYKRLGGPQGRSGRVRKISPQTGVRTPNPPARSESLYRLSCPSHRYSPIIVLLSCFLVIRN
jgi:hypothetical protein